VDWIFAQAGQYEVVEAKVIDNDEASDHRAIVAEVKFYVK
jgi:endonuclease/exonuclease/phosphatase (EEP) superfamily protein YafD